MTVTVNGQPTTIPDAASVAALIESLGLAGAACAVEVNRDLVPKRRHEQHRLQDGDTVEIVTLVGGG